MNHSGKTVFITGASSGIGLATAKLFSSRGWNVVAGVRRPEAEIELVETDCLKILSLDVQEPESIRSAVAEAVLIFGAIDVWINNAGYGTFGPVEAGTSAQIRRQFDVNVFGLIDCIRAIGPHFRANRRGVIINVSSAGGFATSPGYSVYNASKFAVEGLSEGLWYELKGFGIKVKIIEPGITKTHFGGRSMDVWDHSPLPEYTSFMEKVMAARARLTRDPSTPELVASTILKAATDRHDRLRYLVGADAKLLWRLRRSLGYRAQMRILSRAFRL